MKSKDAYDLEDKCDVIFINFLFIFFLLLSMLFQYAVLLFLLLVAQIIIGVLIFTNKREVERVSERILRNLWTKKESHRAFWDTMQQGVNFRFLFILQSQICFENIHFTLY